jgi:hypothetical protein
MPGSGKITTEYTVWCSRCESWLQTGEHKNKKHFASDLRLYGWKFSKAWGWTCSDHNIEAQEVTSQNKIHANIFVVK